MSKYDYKFLEGPRKGEVVEIDHPMSEPRKNEVDGYRVLPLISRSAGIIYKGGGWPTNDSKLKGDWQNPPGNSNVNTKIDMDNCPI